MNNKNSKLVLSKTIQCPTCQKAIEYKTDNPSRPFCSERCKLIDLGAWADEQHQIPGEQVNPENLKGDDKE